jgi:multiple antibiotic resistance protein
MTAFSAALTLFLVMDPIGNAPVFLVLLGEIERRRRPWILLRESLIALAILLIFLLFGPLILEALQVESLALRFAGGVVLLIVALRMLFPREGGVMGEEEVEGEPLVVPIATPMIAGPSAIATVMLLAAREDLGSAPLLGALAIAWIATVAILLMAERFSRVLGRRGMLALQRLMGLLLTVMAVQMLMDGVELFMETSLPAAR